MAPADWPPRVMASGFAAEGGDVALHPLQRRDHVLQAVVAGRLVLARRFRGERRRHEEAEEADAIIDRDYDDTAARRVSRRRTPHADPEPETKPPPGTHTSTGSRRRTSGGGRPDVEIQTILADPALRNVFVRPGAGARGSHGLPTARRESPRGANALPAGRRLRRAPAIAADGRRCVGNAEKGIDRPCLKSGQRALRDANGHGAVVARGAATEPASRRPESQHQDGELAAPPRPPVWHSPHDNAASGNDRRIIARLSPNWYRSHSLTTQGSVAPSHPSIQRNGPGARADPHVSGTVLS